MPVYVFVGIGVLGAAMWPGLQRVATRRRIHMPDQMVAIVLAVAAALVAELAGFLTGVTVTPGSLLLNSVLLVAVALVAGWLVGEATYDDVVRDVRFGMIALVCTAGFAYVVLGSGHVNLSPPVYAGVVGYMLLAMVCLSVARRMGEDEESKDQRSASVEPDWILATVVLVLGLALASLVLVQLLGLDVVGSLGALMQKPLSLLLGGLQAVGIAIGRVLAWFMQVLGLQHVHPRRLHLQHVPKNRHHRPSHVRPRSYPTPAWLPLVLKAIGILVVGVILLALIVGVLRASGWLRTTSLRGERRISQWSWRKMFRWVFRRTAGGVSALRPDLRPHLHGPRRLRNLREVYRAFLALGAKRSRPRSGDETGLEYSHVFEARWPASTDALQELNDLYILERYGSRQSSSDTVAKARTSLRDIELASSESGEPAEST